ncbi:hypothetical protein BGZ93_010327 [Podila epicladia]|nr:hypothetical protein BGZ93_010327 [Podila epicladia]
MNDTTATAEAEDESTVPPMAVTPASSDGRASGSPPSLSGSSALATTSIGAAMMSQGNTGPEPLYGEDSIDSGEEIRFSIELCRIKNLKGIYCVDIRRMKGNLWAYKFLYHAVLNDLDLSSKGSYIPTLPPNVKIVKQNLRVLEIGRAVYALQELLATTWSCRRTLNMFGFDPQDCSVGKRELEWRTQEWPRPE